MMTKAETEQALERERALRAQFDEHKRDSIARVRLHLASVAGACLAECKAIERDGEIADGNIDAAWEQLTRAIEQFRDIQQSIQSQDACIKDMIGDLADEELWKD